MHRFVDVLEYSSSEFLIGFTVIKTLNIYSILDFVLAIFRSIFCLKLQLSENTLRLIINYLNNRFINFRKKAQLYLQYNFFFLIKQIYKRFTFPR